MEPINLRFRYHFMGSRSTNRADKPEWAFSSIRDTLVDLTPFLSGYVQPLTTRCLPQLSKVDIVAEFTMLLFPILLSFLRVRVPALLDHPALLAHTVYQCVLFDESIRDSGFQLSKTSLYESGEWEGLTGAVLREEGWFARWLEGEKRFAEDTLNDIISSSTAWDLDADADDDMDGNGDEGSGGPRTESARRVIALLLQITDRYASLPGLEYRQAFLKGVQLPLLNAYHTRISGSLDAFETLSSAFVRAVPGSLTLGRGTDEKLKGAAGLERLLKAHASARPVCTSLREWGDEPLFVDMSAELGSDTLDTGVWDGMAERYSRLAYRAEDMAVAQASSSVESHQRSSRQNWAQIDDEGPGAQLDAATVAALTEYGRLLSLLPRYLTVASVLRAYRRISVRVVAAITESIAYAKFTSVGGRAFLHLVKDWIAAAHDALGAGLGQRARLLDSPWARLEETARILALPSDSSAPGAEGVTFAQGMAAAWGGEEAYGSLQERLGIRELTRDEVQDVLRKREECWR